MEPHAPQFPSFVAPLSDLYGANSYRAAEAHAYAQELEDLDREELTLEQTMRALVDRKAPPPVGLHFHKAKGSATASANTSSFVNTSIGSNRLQRGGVAPVGTEGSRLGSGVQTTRGYHGHVAEDDDDEEEEDMEEDDMEEEEEEEEDDLHELDDDEEEEEEGEGDELFPDDDGEGDDGDPAGDDSMDMSM